MKRRMFSEFWLVLLSVTTMARGGDLFVDSTGTGGAYTTIQAAFSAATAGATIWVRSGQTFGGATLTWTSAKNGVKLYGGWNGNTNMPYSKNAKISANDPTNLYNANPARDAETVFNGPNTFVAIGTASAVDGVTIRGFSLQNTAGTTIDFLNGSVAYRRNIDISNNIIQTPAGGQGVSMQQAVVPVGGANSNILFSGNRFLLGTIGNNTAIIANGVYDFENITIVDNYFKNTAASTDGRAINADGFRYQVQARNVFDSFPRGSVNNDRGYMIMAENVMTNIGSRGMNWQAFYGPGLGPALISKNEITMKNDPTGATAGSAWAFNVLNSGQSVDGPVWVRHNKATASNYGGAQLVTFANGGTSAPNVTMEFSRNELTVGAWTGTASERGVLRLLDNLAKNTQLTDNKIIMPANGALTDAQNNGVLAKLAPMAPGASVIVSWNSITGTSGAGTGVRQADAAWTNGTVTLSNNNFVSTATDVVNNATTLYITGTGNYFDNGQQNAGNVALTSDAGSPNPVAGRNANYVTFRGDFNLDNAVNDADRLVWTNNFGTSGPGVTYFSGDATLDQTVSAADLLVWKRYNGLDINATAPAASPTVPPAIPAVEYWFRTGMMRIADNGSTAWAFEITLLSNAATVSAHTEGNLGTGWAFAAFTNWPATNRVEFVDVSAGSSQAPMAAVQVAQFPSKLSSPAFGTVKYYVGSNVFETSIALIDPTGTFYSIR